jgi:hypothetical protein
MMFAGASGACSTRQGDTAASGSDRDLVTGEELVATNARDVYRALERLRPTWLTSRGPANMGNVRDATEAVANVYMNGSRMGSVDYLKQVYVSDVHEIRFWGSGEAGARFGMGNPRGVIEIIPRR